MSFDPASRTWPCLGSIATVASLCGPGSRETATSRVDVIVSGTSVELPPRRTSTSTTATTAAVTSVPAMTIRRHLTPGTLTEGNESCPRRLEARDDDIPGPKPEPLGGAGRHLGGQRADAYAHSVPYREDAGDPAAHVVLRGVRRGLPRERHLPRVDDDADAPFAAVRRDDRRAVLERHLRQAVPAGPGAAVQEVSAGEVGDEG